MIPPPSINFFPTSQRPSRPKLPRAILLGIHRLLEATESGRALLREHGLRFERVVVTNEMDLPPGVIVELYRRRWDAEKVFDQIKNKLQEKKAWAASLVAKESQALLVAITHNQLLLYERRLEQNHGVINEAEDRRRAKRTQEAQEQCQAKGKPLSELVVRAQRATQRSVKFVRWIRQSIRDQAAEATAVLRLKQLYATL